MWRREVLVVGGCFFGSPIRPEMNGPHARAVQLFDTAEQISEDSERACALPGWRAAARPSLVEVFVNVHRRTDLSNPG